MGLGGRLHYQTKTRYTKYWTTKYNENCIDEYPVIKCIVLIKLWGITDVKPWAVEGVFVKNVPPVITEQNEERHIIQWNKQR